MQGRMSNAPADMRKGRRHCLLHQRVHDGVLVEQVTQLIADARRVQWLARQLASRPFRQCGLSGIDLRARDENS